MYKPAICFATELYFPICSYRKWTKTFQPIRIENSMVLQYKQTYPIFLEKEWAKHAVKRQHEESRAMEKQGEQDTTIKNRRWIYKWMSVQWLVPIIGLQKLSRSVNDCESKWKSLLFYARAQWEPFWICYFSIKNGYSEGL